MKRHLPVIPSNYNVPESISEGMDKWRANHARNAKEDLARSKSNNRYNPLLTEKTKMSVQNTQEAGVAFTLKTEAGELSFKQSKDGTYTDFVRVAFEMMLAFNVNEIDPELKKVLHRALLAYENNETFMFDDGDDIDFLREALENAQSESEKIEEATKHITTLPPSEKLTLQILSSDLADISRIDMIISKNTDLPPNFIREIIHECKPFTLPFEKAKDIYVKLRTLDVMLTIKSSDMDDTKATTKKGAAAKKGMPTKQKKLANEELVNKKLTKDDGTVE